jgi:DNA-binding CsgD family transcriptional regulator
MVPIASPDATILPDILAPSCPAKANSPPLTTGAGDNLSGKVSFITLIQAAVTNTLLRTVNLIPRSEPSSEEASHAPLKSKEPAETNVKPPAIRMSGNPGAATMRSASWAGVSRYIVVVRFDRRIQSAAAGEVNRSIPVLQKMTAAERRVALVLMDGLSNQEIADRLAKSVHAVKFLLHRIYQKTGVPNRAALVAALGARHDY